MVLHQVVYIPHVPCGTLGCCERLLADRIDKLYGKAVTERVSVVYIYGNANTVCMSAQQDRVLREGVAKGDVTVFFHTPDFAYGDVIGLGGG